MAERDLYTSDQLAKIRATLQDTLGESSGGALENLDARFTAKEDAPKEEINPKASARAKKKAQEENAVADIKELLEENKLKKMIAAVSEVKDQPDEVRTLIGAILAHPEVKAFHLVEAISKIKKDDVPLIDALVEGITSRKGVNPLIEALRHATASTNAVKALAMGIAEQGTVNHLIRAIATSPRDQPEAEIIWAMEVMGKGSMEQLLEAIKLLDPASPGTVILATGLVNRKEVAIEPLVRALTAAKENAKACSLLAVALARLADQPQLISLLEKYVSDDTEAAEILVAKLVLVSLREKGRAKLMAKATGFMRGDSMAGKILAMGIVEQGDHTQLERTFARMKSHPVGQKMAAVAIKKKLGGMKAIKLLGGVFFQLSKFEDEVRKATAEAKQRYKQITEDILQDIPPAKSAKDSLLEDI
ncbi:MAG: hypothetical protein HQL72_04840 [Magnetococcales bacterium]|nr:hypothetical protein [Magnetococcales bacterium]